MESFPFWVENRHNHGVETVDFEGIDVEIRRKAHQRRLGVSVYPNGKVRISANKTLSQKQIFQFLLEKKSWIQKTLKECEKVRSKYPPKRFQAGEKYPYLGKEYKLCFVQSSGRPYIQFHGDELRFISPLSENDMDFHRRKSFFQILKKSYIKVAEELMTQRVDEWSVKMNLKPSAIGFRMQKSIWGSCSPENKISLNKKLIVAPLDVIDYVVVHELAHIRYKNHSKQFWVLVEKYVDNHESSRQWLNENLYLSDFLSSRSELWP